MNCDLLERLQKSREELLNLARATFSSYEIVDVDVLSNCLLIKFPFPKRKMNKEEVYKLFEEIEKRTIFYICWQPVQILQAYPNEKDIRITADLEIIPVWVKSKEKKFIDNWRKIKAKYNVLYFQLLFL